MNEDMERQILGTMLYDAKVIPDVSEILDTSAFTTHANKLIYNAITDCYEKYGSCDVMLCATELDSNLNRAGGAVELHDMQASIVESVNIDYYVSELKEVWLKRQIINSAQSIKAQVESHGELSATELLDKSQAILYKLDAHHSQNDIRSSDEILPEVVDRIADPSSSGTNTGFIELDKLGAIEGGQFIIIAARPGIGKSTLAINILVNIRTIYNRPVLIFSMEMPAREIQLRIVSMMSGLHFGDLKKGIVKDKQALINAITRIQHQPIFIKDEAGIHINTLRANARQIKREYPDLAAIAIDYLQLARTDAKTVRELEVAEVARAGKNLAMELDVPVIGLSQLSRANERRPNREPQLSDTRECVTGDSTIVDADNGKIVSINEIMNSTKVSNVFTLSEYDFRICKNKLIDVWYVGKKDVYKLSTRNHSIICTKEHKFFTPNGYIELANLKVKDVVLTPSRYKTNAGVFCESIESIEYIGTDEVYDVSVEKIHNLFINNILSSNSGEIENSSDEVLMLDREDAYSNEALGGTIDCYIRKNRNGPLGKIVLGYHKETFRMYNL
tara:strand:+ start:200 stop:1882 length:1683 start_codon:yes stop_codon:yes gene_type:complete